MIQFFSSVVGMLILGVTGSIIGNLLTPYTQEVFKEALGSFRRALDSLRRATVRVLQIISRFLDSLKSDSASSEPRRHHKPQQASIEEPGDLEEIRRRNRERLTQLGELTFLYLYTSFLLFGAFYIPIGLSLFPEKVLLLSETRLSWLCSSCSLEEDTQVAISSVSALLFYYPVWLLAQRGATLLKRGLHYVVALTSRQYTVVLVIVFLVIALFISGHVVYALFPRFSYLGALSVPIVVVAMAFVFFSAQKDANQ